MESKERLNLIERMYEESRKTDLADINIPNQEEYPKISQMIFNNSILVNSIINIPVPKEDPKMIYQFSEENRVEPYITPKIVPPSDIVFKIMLAGKRK